jgi:phosphatidate phosphatase APP1
LVLTATPGEAVSFVHHIDPFEAAAVEDAIRIVQELYPGQRIWAEHPAPSFSESAESSASSAPLRPGGWKHLLQTIATRAEGLYDQARQHLTERSPLMVLPYIGYINENRLTLGGRVLKDVAFADPAGSGGLQNLFELYKRLDTDEVPGARLRARFNGVEGEAMTGKEGYFHLEIPVAGAEIAPGWHTLDIELLAPLPESGKPLRASARILAPPAGARYGIISDIDDTVVWTNVTNKLRMLLMLARSNAYTRKPFKGVAAFYRALQEGVGGDEGNPVFYVSSSPWNLYTPLVDFMAAQDIPPGPLFLRDYGAHMLFGARDHHGHKLSSIERILNAYPRMQFILIGDSGEQDPEIYSKVVERYPNRVRVIYIRNVNPDPTRVEALDLLAEKVSQTGAQLVLTPDSEYAAMHAASEGLISRDALAVIRGSRKQDERAVDLQRMNAASGDPAG